MPETDHRHHQTVQAATARRRRLLTSALVALGSVLAFAGLAQARAAAPYRAVRYHGLTVTVPSGWPVFNLARDPHVCVRFNRHAVYLGRPGSDQSCPIDVVGRTEAILVSPGDASATAVAARAGLTPVSVAGAAPRGGSMARVPDRRHHLLVTATWNRHPGLIRRALSLRSLRAAVRATNGHRPRIARDIALRPQLRAERRTELDARPRARAAAGSAAPTTTTATTTPTPPAPTPTPALPGQVYSGLGFDACQAPSATTMSTWASSSPYHALGIYIGGTNMGCPQTNLTAAWVSAESAAGWHMIPTYVGLQAPINSCKCAAMSSNPTQASSQGTAAALDAVAQAQALGLGPGNPIYYDMENYTTGQPSSPAVLAFLQAWTVQLHSSGYLSGVYSSGSSGITDLVNAQGTTYVEPDELWIAHWDGNATTADSYVPAADWANNQRIRQYNGGHNESYGGVTINIDNDDLDAPTAAAGSGTAFAAATIPILTVTPRADGTVALTPSWTQQPGVAQFVIQAGFSPTALSTVATVAPGGTLPVVLNASYPYYQLQALDSNGALLGSSQPIQTPSSVAIFGNSAFAPARGAIGIPVSCLNAPTCSVHAAIFWGKKRLTHSSTQSIWRSGGTVFLPVMNGVRKALAAHGSRKVTVTVVDSAGHKASRRLTLYSYDASGRAPQRKIWNSPTLRVLAKTNFVSNDTTGGILAACRSTVPCQMTMRITLHGDAIATARKQTLGPDEVGYVIFRMNRKGHDLLRAAPGNQLGARVQITTAPAPTPTSGGLSTTPGATAMALVSLVGFR